MQQIIQDLKSGDKLLENVPVPVVGPGNVLIKTHRSLVSLGKKNAGRSVGQANLLEKAREVGKTMVL